MTRPLSLLPLLWAFGCAHQAAVPKSEAISQGVAEYYPLEAGGAWSYDVIDARGDHTLAVARVSARSGSTALVDTGAERQEYDVTDEAITRRPSGTVALRRPLAVGTRWSLPDGGEAQITNASARVEVPAGNYSGCVVVEETAPDRRVVTSYARQVGPVLIEVYARGSGGEALLYRGVLRGYHKAGTPTL